MDLDEERRARAASGKDPQLPISGSLQPRVGHSLAEFEKTQEVLDALPIPIVLIDSEGIICSVNGPWRRLAAENGMAEPESWIGVNYLSICELASGDSSQGAKSAADGIRRVLRGEIPSFSLDYPCDSATERRWFRLTASPQTGELSGAIVMHLDITDCKRADLQETHVAAHSPTPRVHGCWVTGMRMKCLEEICTSNIITAEPTVLPTR
jgi:PAS domain-containing protein